MKPDYLETLLQELIKLREDSPIQYKAYFSKKINDNYLKMIVEKEEAPVVVLFSDYQYLTDNSVHEYKTIDSDGKIHTHQIDIQKEMLASLDIRFIILSNNPSETVAIEDYLVNRYEVTHSLNVAHPFLPSQIIPYNVSMNSRKLIDRCNIDGSVESIFSSTLWLECDKCVFFSEDYHPGMVAFDSSLQLWIIKRIIALQNLSTYFADQLPFFMTFEKDSMYTPSEIDLDNQKKSLEAKEAANKLRISSEVVPEGYDECLFLVKIVNIMENEDCDVKQAISIFDQNKELYKKEVQELKDEKKKKNAEMYHRYQMYLSRGDKVINEYTDAIVEDIKAKIDEGFGVTVFGGSSFQDFSRAFYEKILPLPVILIREEMDFSFDYKTYEVEQPDGSVMNYYFNAFTLPIKYGIIAEIYTDNKEQGNVIAKHLQSIYVSKNQMYFPVKNIPNVKKVLNFSIDSEKPIWQKDLSEKYKGLYKTTITFMKYPNVYISQSYDEDEIVDNQRLQYRMVQQGRFLLQCIKKIKDEALPEFHSEYKNLILRRRSLLGVLDSKEYKELRDAFFQGLPISREMFDAGLKKVTTVYPMLYDKMIQQWPFEQIEENIINLQKSYEKRFEKICDQLAIDSTSFEEIGIRESVAESLRDIKCFEFYESKMEDSEKMISELFPLCEDYMWQKELEAQKFDEAFDEAFDEVKGVVNNHIKSSGGSLVGSLVGSTVGTSLGNRKTRKEAKKQTEELQKQTELIKKQHDEAERTRKREAALQSQREWDAVKRANDERRRKGQPELPLPPRSWY